MLTFLSLSPFYEIQRKPMIGAKVMGRLCFELVVTFAMLFVTLSSLIWQECQCAYDCKKRIL